MFRFTEVFIFKTEHMALTQCFIGSRYDQAKQIALNQGFFEVQLPYINMLVIHFSSNKISSALNQGIQCI